MKKTDTKEGMGSMERMKALAAEKLGVTFEYVEKNHLMAEGVLLAWSGKGKEGVWLATDGSGYLICPSGVAPMEVVERFTRG